MRISIWQQFSSNHSSSYTVVGEFETVEAAHFAQKQVIQIVREAVDWCFAHRDECYAPNPKYPSPVEEKYGKEFGFKWKEQIDWLTYGVHEENINQVERLVVVTSRRVDTWQTGHQFADLLAAMHGKVAREVMEGREPGVEEEVWMSLGLDVKSDCPPDTAAFLQSELQQLIETRNRARMTHPIPWLIYRPKLGSYSADMIRRIEAQYLADDVKAQELHDKHGIGYEGFHQDWEKVRVMSHEQWVFIGDCRNDMEIFRLDVNPTSHGIEIANIQFREIAAGFPALMKYLQDKGCENVIYSVRQHG